MIASQAYLLACTDCTFKGQAEWSANADGNQLALQRCSLGSALHVWRAQVRAEGCLLYRVELGGFNDSPRVYTDTPVASLEVSTVSGLDPKPDNVSSLVLPLAQAPAASAFLQSDDPFFAQLRQVRSADSCSCSALI